jgi:hypothetical protein
MKKCIITLIAVCLLTLAVGGQVFAMDVIPYGATNCARCGLSVTTSTKQLKELVGQVNCPNFNCNNSHKVNMYYLYDYTSYKCPNLSCGWSTYDKVYAGFITQDCNK